MEEIVLTRLYITMHYAFIQRDSLQMVPTSRTTNATVTYY